MTIQEKDKRLKQLIIELAHDYKLNDDKFQKYVKEFTDIYTDDYRHEYSDITRVLFSIEKDEERDFLPQKIKDIRDKMKDGNAKKSVGKLWDHINLENIRSTELGRVSKNANDEIRRISKSANDDLINFEKKVEDINQENTIAQEGIKGDIGVIQDDINKFNKKMESAQISYVSILGIFSSITFALFGGLNILAQIFSKITNLKDHDVFLGIMVIGGFVVFSIFNLLNILLYSIGRIVDKDLISTRCKDVCKKDKCDCKLNKKIFKKYPHIAITNISIIVFVIIFLVAYLITG